ncbi:MAG: hypothetical protein ACLUO4_03760 [Christensenellales bacterium]
MNGLIYTGGDWPDRQTARRLYEQADFVVCCDGAAVRRKNTICRWMRWWAIWIPSTLPFCSFINRFPIRRKF